MRTNGWRRRERELNRGRGETGGSAESSRHTTREEDGKGRRESGESGMDPEVGWECWKGG